MKTEAGPGPSVPELVLASGSPRRRELLSMLGLSFRVLSPDIEEVSAHSQPADIALDLALQKGRAVAAREPGATVISCDTLVALGGEVLGKPQGEEQNRAYLRLLSGRVHSVHSGVALLCPDGRTLSGGEETRVRFRPLLDAEVRHYAASGEGLDKAGGYGIQGLGMALVERVEGDYSNVVGFPLGVVTRLLREAGLRVWGVGPPGGAGEG